MLRHSWYLSPELATVALFSKQVPDEEKSELISNMIVERGSHVLHTLPSTVSQLKISRSFFTTSGTNDSFLEIPVCEWHQSKCYTSAVNKIKNIPCVNDIAERGVALIQTFNAKTKNEAQKQYLLAASH